MNDTNLKKEFREDAIDRFENKYGAKKNKSYY